MVAIDPARGPSPKRCRASAATAFGSGVIVLSGPAVRPPRGRRTELVEDGRRATFYAKVRMAAMAYLMRQACIFVSIQPHHRRLCGAGGVALGRSARIS